MGIDEVKKVINSWAQNQPLIKRAFIFGSRARGDHQTDSDLDVAVELHLGGDDNSILSTWMFEEDEMKQSLQDLIPFNPTTRLMNILA